MTEPPIFKPKKILEVLHKHDVRCVVLGGIASTLHGAPFPTSDVDICPALDTGNLDKLSAALKELDAVMLATDEPEGLRLDFTGKNLKKWLVDFNFLHLMTAFGQLDLLYRPDGTEGYRDLSRDSIVEDLGGELEITIAALGDVIRSKQAAGRERDLQQLPTLRKLLEMQEQVERGGSS